MWQKSYFRKGCVLFVLKMYKEAEQAYEKAFEFENNRKWWIIAYILTNINKTNFNVW